MPGNRTIFYLLGVYRRPTEGENKYFSERLEYMDKLMTRRKAVYEVERKALEVMLTEEEEEKYRKKREERRIQQGWEERLFLFTHIQFTYSFILSKVRWNAEFLARFERLTLVPGTLVRIFLFKTNNRISSLSSKRINETLFGRNLPVSRHRD